MTKLLLVGAGGFAGALLRYVLASAVAVRSPGPFPWSTLTVNALGCLVIGLLMGLAESRAWFTGELRLLVFTGVLGSFTTFSTFGYDAWDLLRRGEGGTAFLYVGASVVLGLLLVGAGFLGGRQL